jgi:hypothetical protein
VISDVSRVTAERAKRATIPTQRTLARDNAVPGYDLGPVPLCGGARGGHGVVFLFRLRRQQDPERIYTDGCAKWDVE